MFGLLVALLAVAGIVLYYRLAVRPLLRRRDGELPTCRGCPGCRTNERCGGDCSLYTINGPPDTHHDAE